MPICGPGAALTREAGAEVCTQNFVRVGSARSERRAASGRAIAQREAAGTGRSQLPTAGRGGPRPRHGCSRESGLLGGRLPLSETRAHQLWAPRWGVKVKENGLALSRS